MDTIRLSVLVYEDGDLWVAQAIEADILVTASGLDKLPYALERAVVANLAANAQLGRKGLDGIPPAAEMVREKFERSPFSLLERLRGSPPNKKVELQEMRLLTAA